MDASEQEVEDESPPLSPIMASSPRRCGGPDAANQQAELQSSV